jgi:DNA primase
VDELAKAADASIDVFDRKVQILQRGGWFADLHRRRRAIDYLLPTIRACSDALLRGMYISRAAEVSGVDPRVLESEAGSIGEPRGRALAGAPKREQPVQPSRESPRQARPRAPRPPERATGEGFSAERELIRAMLKQRSLVERLTERVGPDSFQEPRYREIFATLLQPGPETSVQELAAAMTPPAVEMMQSLLGEPDAIQDLDRTVEHSLARLDERQLARRNREIDRLISMAAAGEKNQLMQEKESNRREIARLRELRERQ